MSDAAGNDILAVGVPITGFVGIAPFGTTIPTNPEGAADDLTLDAAFRKLGLLKTDGGPQLAWGPDGDPLEFWQDEYEIQTGDADVALTVSAAEALNDVVREIIAGVAPDADGVTDVDGGGHDERYVLFVEAIFKNGAIRRRVLPNCTLRTATEDQSTRGEVEGVQLVFGVKRSSQIGNKHFREWVLPAEADS
jgi:hypothetical protein